MSVTMNDVAKTAGVSLSTVSYVVNGKREVSDEVRDRVMGVVAQLGYTRDKKCERCGTAFQSCHTRQRMCPACAKAPKPRKPETFYYGGCFHTKAEEVKRMKELRAEGFTNKEIAAKIGRAVLTIRRNIGAQPADMTKENRVNGQKQRSARREQRLVYVATHTVNQFNELVGKVEEVNKEINRLHLTQMHLTQQMQSMIPAVNEAAKKSKVQPVAYNPPVIPAPDATNPIQ